MIAKAGRPVSGCGAFRQALARHRRLFLAVQDHGGLRTSHARISDWSALCGSWRALTSHAIGDRRDIRHVTNHRP